MVEAVILIATTLIENIDLLLEAAFTLISGLAQGLLNALPTLIEALPQIISSIVTFLIGNYPKLIEMGIMLIVQLGTGLIKAIPQIISKIPQIISAIVGGLGKAIPSMNEVGRNIIQGLWSGISSMIGWVQEKVGKAMGGIVGGVKRLLGIQSPSKVFAGIGSNMGEGIAVGFSDAMKGVEEDMKKAIPTEFEGLDVDVNAVGNVIPDTSSSVSGGMIPIEGLEELFKAMLEKFGVGFSREGEGSAEAVGGVSESL